jgi:hypothetical protein
VPQGWPRNHDSAHVDRRTEDNGRIIHQSICRDITRRKQVEDERERLIGDPRTALAEVKTLSGMLPICASCKRIRDDRGYWQQIEAYSFAHSATVFSQSVCPECAQRLYPMLKKRRHLDGSSPLGR